MHFILFVIYTNIPYLRHMGQNCRQVEKPKEVSTYALSQLEPFPWVNFQVTTEKLTRIDS